MATINNPVNAPQLATFDNPIGSDVQGALNSLVQQTNAAFAAYASANLVDVLLNDDITPHLGIPPLAVGQGLVLTLGEDGVTPVWVNGLIVLAVNGALPDSSGNVVLGIGTIPGFGLVDPLSATSGQMLEALYSASGFSANFRQVNSVPSRRYPLLATAANASTALDVAALITSIVIVEKAGHAITGGLDIGTTNGGTDIASAVAVGANATVVLKQADLLKLFFSESATQNIFFNAHTSWNSASIDIFINVDLMLVPDGA